MNLINHLINGIHVGSIYALVALGYNMVYGIVKLINFAHGDIIMAGAYVAFFALDAGMPTVVAVAASVVFCVVLGVVIEKVAYRPLRKSAKISLLITAIGISLLLENTAQKLFSATPRLFPKIIEGGFYVGDRQISMTTIVTIAVSGLLMAGLTVFVKTTNAGKAMRAVSEDTEAAQLMGINVDRTISMTFAIGSGLAAIAAVLYCCSYPQVYPTMGALFGIKAFVAAVLGGIGSIPGAVVGGLMIGIAEALTKGYLSSMWADAIVFSFLIITLLLKPSGILGRKVVEKV
ncbi:MAG: branched-chain amino acid ABC transporter permease [Oscillospiraceae bacterium]|nr:branched-chain amino acid ABC transporter permease [Oscillospiraceae bacterium]MBQ5341723.1 branched-chain amino acid ABC transporter permease [Oscillospiraceae bacterium]MBR5065378.1 branched-chain amino acid ABC transporter permease [Oscillospiraceae bacterium]